MGKAFTLKLFDQNDKASFAQAVEVALSQSRIELRTPGALVQELRCGEKPFVYWHRYTPDGSLEKQYVGPLGGAEDEVARQQQGKKKQSRQTLAKVYG
ncbi:MAG: hypothetical protein ACRERD_34465 [Candidatus Binatia bacterium]